MKAEEIAAINAIVDRLPTCSCASAEHEEGCIVPMLLDLHRRANESMHTITILKLDVDEEEAKRLAE